MSFDDAKTVYHAMLEEGGDGCAAVFVESETVADELETKIRLLARPDRFEKVVIDEGFFIYHSDESISFVWNLTLEEFLENYRRPMYERRFLYKDGVLSEF